MLREHYEQTLTFRRARLLLLVLFFLGCSPAVDLFAQRAPASAPSEADLLAEGWALLAQRNSAKASVVADTLLKRYPRSAAVLAFAVDTAVAQQGALAALDMYERWLGKRTFEAAYVLRRVALAAVRETVGARQDTASRLQALELLVAEGDTQLVRELEANVERGGIPEAALLAGAGNDRAVDSLAEALKQPGANQHAVIAALAKSGHPRAPGALIALLTRPDPAIRAAAADGLGSLGATEAIPHIKPLLDDPMFPVHMAAASALLALKDRSGLPWLRDLLASEHAGIRLAAAQATRSEPDPNWLQVVRALTRDADAEIRRQAAELIAPHEPDTAKAVLDPLLHHENPAQREAAATSYVRAVGDDLATLRRFLRSTDAQARLQAAGQILRLTR